MAEAEKVGAGVKEEEEEEQKFLEDVTVLDFDMLCSTVASQTQAKWRNLDTLHHDESQDGVVGAEFGGVLRMWEGELVNCFDDRRIALQSACCPCYRFGKNMGRAGFGSCFVQNLYRHTYTQPSEHNLIDGSNFASAAEVFIGDALPRMVLFAALFSHHIYSTTGLERGLGTWHWHQTGFAGHDDHLVATDFKHLGSGSGLGLVRPAMKT